MEQARITKYFPAARRGLTAPSKNLGAEDAKKKPTTEHLRHKPRSGGEHTPKSTSSGTPKKCDQEDPTLLVW